ncbi:MAG: hypothetical protein K9J83_07555 [Desulfarculaceae bacterium]|nr:hypothetical protein [Desulfarculaceae bacterium]
MSESGSNGVKDRTTGQFRCLYCFTRVKPPRGAETFTCENCGYAWRIWWFSPTEPRIRGPVWDQHEKLSREKMKKQGD